MSKSVVYFINPIKSALHQEFSLNIGYFIITQAAAVIGSPLCMRQPGSGDMFSLHSLQLAARFLDIERALVVQGEGDYRNQRDGQYHG